jgi:peptidylprolyl isomerase
MRRAAPRALAVPLFALLAVVTAACGSTGSKVGSSASNPTTSTPASTAAPAGTVGAIPQADRSPAGVFGKKPTVVVPAGPPPSGLEAADLIAGKGAAAQAGQNVTVQYVGVSYTLKKQFDASWDRNQPFSFPLGQGQVIRGWDVGVVGMKVGGRRELIIPPSMAYAANPPPGAAIAANDTLIFVVDLVSIG